MKRRWPVSENRITTSLDATIEVSKVAGGVWQGRATMFSAAGAVYQIVQAGDRPMDLMQFVFHHEELFTDMGIPIRWIVIFKEGAPDTGIGDTYITPEFTNAMLEGFLD